MLSHLLFPCQHRADVRSNTSSFDFAESCVFIKQSLLPFVNLLPKLQLHFAEFLLHCSLNHFRIFYLSTCVSFWYGFFFLPFFFFLFLLLFFLAILCFFFPSISLLFFIFGSVSTTVVYPCCVSLRLSVTMFLSLFSLLLSAFFPHIPSGLPFSILSSALRVFCYLSRSLLSGRNAPVYAFDLLRVVSVFNFSPFLFSVQFPRRVSFYAFFSNLLLPGIFPRFLRFFTSFSLSCSLVP